jgi:hypothetical protein
MKPSEKLRLTQQKIKKKLNDISLKQQMEDVPKIIKERTREGFGISGGEGRKKKLKELAESTIKSRRSKKLSSETTPSTSNLTETGKLLDGIKVKSSNKKTVQIVSGREDVRDYIEKDRKFLGLTKGELTELDKKMEKLINELILEEFGD